MGKRKRKPLQWHPAFYAGLQIELDAEAENLIFENEHHLGTKPKQIDVLIIKKETEKPIHKNIGRIFRKRNIIEYKEPDDYLSIDDFYKVYGYGCFYKSDNQSVDAIKIEEITISFVCYKYPRKLIAHLKKQNFKIQEAEQGIYYIEGFQIPIQIILASKLSKKENLWIRNLTNNLHEMETARELLEEYEKHKNDTRYESVMDLIVNANKEVFQKGDEKMCQALVEIVEEMMEEKLNDRFKEGQIEGEVRGTIKMLMRYNESTARIVEELITEFNISQDSAEEYLDRFNKGEL